MSLLGCFICLSPNACWDELSCSVKRKCHPVWWLYLLHTHSHTHMRNKFICMFYLDRAAFRENTSVWCFWSSDDHLFQEAFRSSDLPQIPANNWTHAVYAVSHTQTHTQTFTQTCTTSHSHSKPAGSKILFHRVYSPFLQPTFRCFLNSALFYSALPAGLTHTHTLICWKQPSRFSFRYRTPNTATLTHAYTLCSCRPPVRHQAFRSAAGCDIIMAHDAWCSQILPTLTLISPSLQ